MIGLNVLSERPILISPPAQMRPGTSRAGFDRLTVDAHEARPTLLQAWPVLQGGRPPACGIIAFLVEPPTPTSPFGTAGLAPANETRLTTRNGLLLSDDVLYHISRAPQLTVTTPTLSRN